MSDRKKLKVSSSFQENLLKIIGLDLLAGRLFRQYDQWSEIEQRMFIFMIESNIREVDYWVRRRNRESQTKAAKSEPP